MAAIKEQFSSKKEEMLEKGAIVLSDILTPAECAAAKQLFLIFYEETSIKSLDHPLRKGEETHRFQYDEPSTYLDCNYLVALHGILKNYEVGWSEFMWALRTHPCVIYVFALIHGTDELVASLDGACFIPNRDLTAANRPSGKKPSELKSWLHNDVDPRFKGLFGIQAQVVLTPGKHLRYVPGSHKKDYSHLVATDAKTGRPPSVAHWFKPPQGTPGFRLEDSALAEAQTGDMILWFSNTTHSGSMQQEERLVAYVCYHPRSHLTPADIKRYKEKIVPERRTTNHWGRGMNAKNPQTYGDPKNDAALLVPRADAYTLWASRAGPAKVTRSQIMTCQSEGHLLADYPLDLGTDSALFPGMLSLERGKAQLKAKAVVNKAAARSNPFTSSASGLTTAKKARVVVDLTE